MGNRDKALVIGALRNKYPLRDLLEILRIAKSSYEYQAAALRSPDKYEELRNRLRAEFEAGKGRYGYRRLHAKLKARGWRVSEKVIRRLMKEERLVVLNTRQRKYNSYMGDMGEICDPAGFPCGQAKREMADGYYGIRHSGGEGLPVPYY